MTTRTRYYHGGPRGLRLVLPPEITGLRSASDYGAGAVHRRDRVYVATVAEAAYLFAALCPYGLGDVYQVEPIGELEPDPDFHGEEGVSLACPRARVIRRVRVDRNLLREIRLEVLSRDFGEKDGPGSGSRHGRAGASRAVPARELVG